jgi:hypothetical protein
VLFGRKNGHLAVQSQPANNGVSFTWQQWWGDFFFFMTNYNEQKSTAALIASNLNSAGIFSCNQCCGSETIFSDPDPIFRRVLEPDTDPTWLVKSFGSSFGSDPKHALFHNANDFKWLFIDFEWLSIDNRLTLILTAS